MNLPLLLAHGGALIPIFLIGLPAAALGLVFLILTAIFHYRNKTTPVDRRTKITGLIAILLGGIALGSPAMLPLVDWVFRHLESSSSAKTAERPAGPSEPSVIAPEQVPKLIAKLPDRVGFGYSGAAYFQEKLYVSSNLGLFIITAGKIECLLQWTRFDAVIEGPWLDGANQALWAQAANDGSLLRFGGYQWTRMSLPEPPVGYTRGDMLHGFGGRSTPRSFWIVGGNCVWRWGSVANSFALEPLPSLPDGSAVNAFFSWDDTRVFLVRDGYQIGIEAGHNPATIHVFNKTWSRFPGQDIDVAETVQTDRFGFIRSRNGALFQLTRDQNQMNRLDVPGRCDAITRTSKGTLLASLGLMGVFERVDDRWEKRAASPFGASEGEHWAYLAESDGEIALATSTVPQLVASSGKFVNSGTAGIWITRNGVFERVDGKR